MTLSEAVEALRAWDPGTGTGQVRAVPQGHGLRLVLDHPSARNALDVGMMVALGECVAAVLADASRSWVLLEATPCGAFCAGGDLRQVQDVLWSAEAGTVMAAAMRSITQALADAPVVVLADVQGPAVGGGAELLTVADEVWVAAGGWVEFRQAALGVGCGWGGAPRLVERVGSSRALRWLTQGGRVPAGEAVDAGWFREAGEGTLAERLVALDALPVAGVRAVAGQVVAARNGADAAVQDALFGAVWSGPAHQEALSRSRGPRPGGGTR